MSGFRYARGYGRSSAPDSRGDCDRCGQTFKLHELKFESIGAKGSPENRKSGLRVCPDCFDPIHELSRRPLAIKQLLPDPEALFQPRPTQFPIAYAVFFTLPGAIFKPNPLSVVHGTLGLNLIGNGIFVSNGQPFSAIGDSNITFNTVTYINEQTVAAQINVSPSANLGIDNNLYIVDGAGNKLRAQLNII